MPLKKFFILLLTCVSLHTFCNGQSTELLKLQTSLPAIHDSLQYVDAINRIGMLLYERNIDSSFNYTKKARDIADRLAYTKGQADALNNLGIIYSIKGNFLRYTLSLYAQHNSINTCAFGKHLAG